MRLIKKIAVFLFGFLGLTLLAGWLLLSSSILAKTRGDLTAQFLSDRLGQEVQRIHIMGSQSLSVQMAIPLLDMGPSVALQQGAIIPQ